MQSISQPLSYIDKGCRVISLAFSVNAMSMAMTFLEVTVIKVTITIPSKFRGIHKKVSTLKRKSLILWSKFFLFKNDPFQKSFRYKKTNRKLQKVVSLTTHLFRDAYIKELEFLKIYGIYHIYPIGMLSIYHTCQKTPYLPKVLGNLIYLLYLSYNLK